VPAIFGGNQQKGRQKKEILTPPELYYGSFNRQEEVQVGKGQQRSRNKTIKEKSLKHACRRERET
jgi:hypothetical protein